MSYKYKPLPHACSLPAPGAFWPRWFHQVLHPGIAPMRNTLHCLYRQAWHFKTSEFRRDRNAKYAIVARRPIHSYAKSYSFYLNESITAVLLHVIPHNCSEIHRNVAIPDYRSLTTQTSGRTFVKYIGYDICEFDCLRGLGIDIIGRVRFDNRDRFARWMGSIGKATEPCQQTSGCWHLTFDCFLNLDMGDDTNTKFLLLHVQTTYMTYKMRGDCWGTWLIMLGFMDLGWPRVCRRSTSVLCRIVYFCFYTNIHFGWRIVHCSLDGFFEKCWQFRSHLASAMAFYFKKLCVARFIPPPDFRGEIPLVPFL